MLTDSKSEKVADITQKLLHEDDYVQTDETMAPKKSSGMTYWEAGLSFLSAIVGCGIVGIPFAMIHTGIPLGVILNIVICFFSVYTGYLYLKC